MLTLPVALIFAHDTSGVGQRGLVWLAVSSLAAVAAFAPFYRAVRLGPVPLVAGIGALEGGVAAVDLVRDRRAAPGAHAARPADRARRHDLRARCPCACPCRRAAGIHCRPACSRRWRRRCSGSRCSPARARSSRCPSSGCRPAAAPSAPCCSPCRWRCSASLPRPGRFLRFIFYSALAQSTGYFAFLVAADSSGVSVPAVLASQASVVGMVISFLVLGERLSHRQLAGIAALLTGVAHRRGDALSHVFIGVLLATITACHLGQHLRARGARLARARRPERAGLDLRRRSRGHPADRADPRQSPTRAPAPGPGRWSSAGRLAGRARDDVHRRCSTAASASSRPRSPCRARSRPSTRRSAASRCIRSRWSRSAVSAVGTFVLIGGAGGPVRRRASAAGILLALGAAPASPASRCTRPSRGGSGIGADWVARLRPRSRAWRS